MMYSDFIEAGHRIFGLYGADAEGKCECGNPECEPKALFKHPRLSNWQNTPAWSDEQIEAMEMTGQLATGYGVLVKSLLVIDVDARNGGVASYAKLAKDIPEVAGAGLIVATGSGNGSKHFYFSVDPSIALLHHHEKYPGIDFKSSGYVVGPGSMHASGTRYEAVVGTPYDITPAPEALINLLRKPDKYRAVVDGAALDVSEAEIAEMLTFISPDCDHETWYRVGMAIHHTTGGAGFQLWDLWSRQSVQGKYPGTDNLQRRWHSFGKSANPVTLGTIVHYAKAEGWCQPVVFEATTDFGEIEAPNGLPFSIDGCDLLRPPGFVGTLAAWISDQCRYPREHLASVSALVAMGNVAGLRYTDDRDDVSLNLFAFCVAGSATGKEAVQQAVAEIHKAAGIHTATHGSIKSEQEIVRNLIRHQAAYYIIDELGILLSKIESARKRGGAAYLDGVIGQLMAAYSKATGFMLLTGDLKDTVRDVLKSELAGCRKMVAENEDSTGYARRRIPSLERAIENLDNGLERPFLSMIGFTTPVTFESLVTREQAENGFIGRSLLVSERETNPRAKRRFVKRKMPDPIRNTLMAIYSGGEYDANNSRVEYYGEKSRIRTTDQAHDMLDDVLSFFEEKAESYKGTNGFEAVPRRGYEMVAKISTILAVPEGLRTAEHVRWAFAMVNRDVEEKTRLAFANEAGNNTQQQLYAAILNKIDQDHGETLAVLANRLRKYKRDDIAKALAEMERAGLVTQEKVTVKNHGEVAKYFAV